MSRDVGYHLSRYDSLYFGVSEEQHQGCISEQQKDLQF